MTKGKSNRKRSIQIKFRLSPEENAIFQSDVKESGMSMNAYLIKTVINHKGPSAINCERHYFNDGVEIHFTIGNQRVGYASCLYIEATQQVQISSFYVVKPIQDIGVEEQLIQEVYSFAKHSGATSIIAYPGPEPYCPGGWKPLDVQRVWYLEHGFSHSHDLFGVIPCMIKEMNYED